MLILPPNSIVGVFLVDTETWSLLEMNLIVDSFTRAPTVVLSEEGHMVLDVTGHRPVTEQIEP